MSIKAHPPHDWHQPVLLDQVISLLQPKPGESYLDLTAGYGGHAGAILDRAGDASSATLVDRDDFAIGQLAPFSEKGARLMHADFVSASKQLIDEGKHFDLILIDLGVSSPQLDQSERGFSFMRSGPLDMRMDRGQELTADTLVNTASEHELSRIIHRYGEELPGNARKIAKTIVENRPIATTGDLAELIKQSASWRNRGRMKIHPATRTFQALRIAVNQELHQVEEVLPLLPKLLNSGGRLAIISFHSLEDRLVKRYFSEQSASGFEAELKILTKKPVDGAIYDVNNPRARSAKLRAAVKI